MDSNKKKKNGRRKQLPYHQSKRVDQLSRFREQIEKKCAKIEKTAADEGNLLITDDDPRFQKPFTKFQSRKAQRKLGRLQKKSKKDEFLRKKAKGINKSMKTQNISKISDLNPTTTSTKKKKDRKGKKAQTGEDDDEMREESKSTKHKIIENDIVEKKKMKIIQKGKNKISKINERRKQDLMKANEDENRTINKIERKLHMKKDRKKVPTSFVNDGLDFLLDVVEGRVSMEAMREECQTNTFLQHDSDSDGDQSHSSDEEVESLSTEKSEESANSDDDDISQTQEEPQTEPQKQTKQKIDPYGGGSASYVPPQKRLAALSDDGMRKEVLERLRKLLKGLINRLSESNIQPIANEIERLYTTNSRNDMNESLTGIILEACLTQSVVPVRMMMEHALLMALLHANIGVEVGAHFIQTLVKRFNDFTTLSDYGPGRQSENAVVLISNMYNFKLIHNTLIHDIINVLLENFTEKDIELLLVVLRSVGFTIRKDDPSGLKNIILKIQTKATQSQEKFKDQSRVKFMLEILTALKNNNMRKIPNYDPSLIEHFRKLLHGLRKGDSGEVLNVSYQDLLSADERGRWWIVGSAWSSNDQSVNTELPSVTESTQLSTEITELARRQRMNTDIRRSIFSVLISSEDYLDAFEKLLRLSLKSQQEREIIHISVDCCLQEKSYNPFYPHLIQKLCQYHRRFQITFQFLMWDKFKELTNLTFSQQNNLTELLTHMLTTQTLSLSVFKVIHFAELNKELLRLMKNVLLSCLTVESDDLCRALFTRIAIIDKLHTLKDGLRLFIRHFIVRNIDKLPTTINRDLLNIRVEIVSRTLESSNKSF